MDMHDFLWTSLTVSCFLICIRRKMKKPEELIGTRVPDVSGRWPFFGHAIQYYLNPSEFFINCYRTYGGIFRLRIFLTDKVVICDPDLASVYLEQAENTLSLTDALIETNLDWTVFDPRIRGFDLNEMKNLFSRMTQNAGGQKYMDIIRNSCIPLMQRLNFLLLENPLRTFDLSEELFYFMSYGVFTCFAPFEHSAAVLQELYSLYNAINNIMLCSVIFPNSFLKALCSWKIRSLKSQLGVNFVKEIRKFRQSANESHTPSLIRNILACNKSKPEPSDEEIGSIMISFIFASATNTTAHVTNTLLKLVEPENERWLAMIRKECEESGDDLEKLFSAPALDSFLLETARQTPHMFSLQRNLMDPKFRLGGYCLGPKGSRLTICAHILQTGENEAQVHREPHRFLPERYDDFAEPKTGSINLTWGKGRHRCPGRETGIKHVKIVVSQFIQNFDIKISKLFEPNYCLPLSLVKLNAEVKLKKV